MATSCSARSIGCFWYLLGSIPGIVIGSYMANRVSEAILRTLLSVILAAVATRLVFA